MTGCISRVKGAKLLVLSENDREMNISTGRVLHCSNSGLKESLPRNEIIKNLQEISLRRREMSRNVNLPELWELLDGEGDEFSYEYLAELAFNGTGEPDHVAAVLRSVFSDGLYFKMRPGSAARNTSEKIEQITQAREKEERKQRELEDGAGWIERIWSGDIYDEPPDCGERIVRLLKDMAVYGQDAAEYKYGLKILEKAGLAAEPLTPFYILVKLGEFDRHENIELRSLNWSIEFDARMLEEAEAVARDFAWKNETRKDLTHLDVITADSGGARDFDDAVSLELKGDRLQLGVHIADVSSVIPVGSGLDDEAFARATSIYMPDMRIPMLPEILSEGCLSLKEGEIRPAFSLLVDLTDEGDVLDFAFTPSLLKVRRQLSYQEVDVLVETDRKLSRMYALSKALKHRRIEAGALIMAIPKLNVYLAPDGEIGVNLTLWENPGRSMISEFMILANQLAARFLNEKHYPCYYRAQKPPAEIVARSDNNCEDLFLCLRQRRYLNRVTWTIKPKPHSGMGLDLYSNLTSPLRRYIDLMIQRQVRAAINGAPPVYAADEMKDRLTVLEATLRKANTLQNKRRRYWLLRYLEAFGRKDYEALVLEKLPNRRRIFLTELMLDAELPAGGADKLESGETILVRIKKVNAREDILKLEQV